MTDAQRRRLTVGKAPEKGSVGSANADGKRLTLCQTIMDQYGFEVNCIHSNTDAELKKTRSFAEKDKLSYVFKSSEKKGEVVAGVVPEPDKDKLPANVFYTCRKGLKPESPNQDSYVVVWHPGKWGLYGVFDGHGPNGHDVSDLAVKVLVERFLLEKKEGNKIGESFTIAFTECQKLIKEQTATAKAEKGTRSGAIDASSSGSTCTMAFHDIETDMLTIAHVGDSRALLFQGEQAYRSDLKKENEGKKATATKDASKEEVKLHHATEDHKPNTPGEKLRIEQMGGRVVFDGYYNYRVFAKTGMYPGLNMSRALGDTVAHAEAGLIAVPELKELDLKELRKKSSLPLNLVIASDGVWEFIENEKAPGFLTEGAAVKTDKAPAVPMNVWKNVEVSQPTCEYLAKMSWDSWMGDSDNEISDDITVVAIVL